MKNFRAQREVQLLVQAHVVSGQVRSLTWAVCSWPLPHIWFAVHSVGIYYAFTMGQRIQHKHYVFCPGLVHIPQCASIPECVQNVAVITEGEPTLYTQVGGCVHVHICASMCTHWETGGFLNGQKVSLMATNTPSPMPLFTFGQSCCPGLL